MRPDHAIPSLLSGCKDPLVVVGRLKGRQERCGKKGFCLHWAENKGQIREILLLCLGHGKWTLLG